jgi:hypothetical protein
MSLGPVSSSVPFFNADRGRLFYRLKSLEEVVERAEQTGGSRLPNMLPKTPHGWAFLALAGGGLLYAAYEWVKGRSAPEPLPAPYPADRFDGFVRGIVAKLKPGQPDPITIIKIEPHPGREPKPTDGSTTPRSGDVDCEAALVACAAAKAGVQADFIRNILRGTVTSSSATPDQIRSVIYIVLVQCWSEMLQAGCENYMRKLIGDEHFELINGWFNKFGDTRRFIDGMLNELVRRRIIPPPKF